MSEYPYDAIAEAITTWEQLETLPDGTVLLDNGGLAWQRIDDFADTLADDAESREGWHCVLGNGEPIELPVRILYRTDWEATHQRGNQ